MQDNEGTRSKFTSQNDEVQHRSKFCLTKRSDTPLKIGVFIGRGEHRAFVLMEYRRLDTL